MQPITLINLPYPATSNAKLHPDPTPAVTIDTTSESQSYLLEAEEFEDEDDEEVSAEVEDALLREDQQAFAVLALFTLALVIFAMTVFKFHPTLTRPMTPSTALSQPEIKQNTNAQACSRTKELFTYNKAVNTSYGIASSDLGIDQAVAEACFADA